MKLSQNLAFLFLLLEEVSNVKALPASNLDPTDAVHDLEGTVNKLLGAIAPGVGLKERDSPLEAVGDLIDAISPTLTKNLAKLEGLTKKFKKSVNLDAPVALDAFKKITTTGADAQDVAGHGIPSELVGSLASKGRSLIETAHGATKGAESLTEELPVAGKKKRATFNADAQRIDVTGSHAFVAPDFENGDVRGPCPGLNALANHGYLPHNGVATLVEYIVGCNTIFGMGIDISTVLAVYGTVEGGNPLSLTPGFSMGGESSASQNLLDNLGGLLGTPRGLSGTHNQYEEDASGTRGDLYDPIGDNTNLNMSYFMDLYNMQIDAEEPNYSMDIMIAHNQLRFEQSEATNPYFFYGPSAGLVVRNAAYAFTGRLFVNTSEEYPEGIINKETLKSFFAVYGDEGNFTYKAGWERIPDIWYRRQSDYTFVSYGLDLVSWVTKFPRLLSIGGNTNGVNTFTEIDIANLTRGLLNAEDLLEGNNLLCFGFEFIKEFTPNSLSSLFATITKPLEMILDILDSTLLSLDCPAFKDLSVNGTDFTEYLKATYPGVAKSGGAM